MSGEVKRNNKSSFFDSFKGRVASLSTLCCDVLREHIDHLPPLQNIPKEVYESILAKCSVEKLQEVEKYNKQNGVNLDTSLLWVEHFKTKFSRNISAFEDQLDNSKKNPWKDLYLRKMSKDAQKIDELSQRLEKYKKEQQKKTEKSQIKVIDVRAANVRKSDQGVSGVLKKAVARVDPSTARNAPTKSDKAESSTGGSSKLWKLAKLGGVTKPAAQVMRPEKIASSAPSRSENQVSHSDAPSHLPPGLQTRRILKSVTTVGRPKIDFTKNRPTSPTQPDWTPVEKNRKNGRRINLWKNSSSSKEQQIK
ncbi:transcription elongation factor B polypeptide 3 [Acrasis kona]|uniref:Transcription elongation factor B polypeptide 3 n=1 Tax=Acrasis kona TaxID=1008807 RepID=A0AAW2YXD2_9EUKA